MLKILIADENNSIMQSCCSFLSKDKNLSIESSSTGLNTLTKYFEYKPNVLILDSGFSDLKTAQIVDILSEPREEKNKCNIILTTNSQSEQVSICNAVKVFRFLPKPYKKQTLLDIINQIAFNYTYEENTDIPNKLNKVLLNNILLNLGFDLKNNGTKYIIEAIYHYYNCPNSPITLDNLYILIGNKYNHTKSEAIRSSIRVALKPINVLKERKISNTLLDLFEDNRVITPKYFIDTITRYLYKNNK
jgi:CheY-like chemotaxis protein